MNCILSMANLVGIFPLHTQFHFRCQKGGLALFSLTKNLWDKWLQTSWNIQVSNLQGIFLSLHSYRLDCSNPFSPELSLYSLPFEYDLHISTLLLSCKYHQHNVLKWLIISKQLDIKLGSFTLEEIDSVLRKIKNRKATGLDEIPPEVWKTRQFDDILL